MIPAYNEEDRIGRAASRVLASKYLAEKCRFLFIVDGNDNTFGILEKLKEPHPKAEMVVKRYPKRLGKGGAVAEGIKAAKTEYVGFLDVDTSIPMEKIEAMVKLLLEKKLDCIIGERKTVEGVPVFRKTSSRAFNLLVNALFGLGVYDTQCGCKFFKRKLVYSGKGEVFRVKGFAFDVELLKKIKESGGRITEHEMVGKWEGGKFSLFESPKMFLELVKLRLS